jgi:ferredoxin/flavodoxin---NADP+ reductase
MWTLSFAGPECPRRFEAAGPATMTPEQITELRSQRYNATVVHLHKPNPELMMIRVKPDFPVPPHRPGQYTSLGLGNWEPRFPGSQVEELKEGEESRVVLRAYSISHPMLIEGKLVEGECREWLEFYIVMVQRASDGARAPGLTPRLFMLRVGDRLRLNEKIAGSFTLEGVQPDQTVVFLSTGTGEAPHNYMLWDLLRRGHRGRILAACCVRYRHDLGYLPIHQALMKHFANYTYLSLTTREAVEDGRKVYIQDLITSGQLEQQLGAALDPGKSHVFLCGNPRMIGMPTVDRESGRRVYPSPPGVIELLEGRGFRVDDSRDKVRGNIHYEKYW